ncbi:MAG: Segregation and condensation protein B [uncultured bacterium]|uniref:Segregation and condensation protein B n=1 Tax=Candidatus Uhrbacteria bacterium GW2011_GWC1_41_20 TaxID=1618983 RepID=A0A0G0VEM9_9BACT|nr:MAG: Segregation and condensation protein B [uncultured bacterium]KKR22717.1 MAG: Segregation and condensation protein B [Candidatus Uhrbacteria bacterium GW2011_GWE1_39_46]KKR64070.1 MAG: Segregation and condensation protein B [Candidatus Uhrbacteria bacterium GW2011_GWC2_40_450]KKR89452.1 MAG: Segregation and condensation protein B [Candidatus Uhrbacteria bacterium GW2011_GWE2_41_1153]KKR89995.1 MAG: Segregation and condensation protein B [Candidatus Uhrbacteria bacterium GW2011_GWD2_41_12
MQQLKSKIQALLFLSTKPITFTRLAKLLKVKSTELDQALKEMAVGMNVASQGIHLIISQDAVTLATNPTLAQELTDLTKDDLESDLTRPQLETLTIVAYRAPITKAEIEQIRGVNCSIILRNLLMRGLIEEADDAHKLTSVYTLSSKMLRHLGIHSIEELPDFAELHQNAKIDRLLESLIIEPEEYAS